jgi:hypothetical protein
LWTRCLHHTLIYTCYSAILVTQLEHKTFSGLSPHSLAMMYMPTEAQISALWPQLDIPESGNKPFTDYSRWRLLVNDGGRHTWHYLQTNEECERWPQNDVDKYWIGIPLVSVFKFWLADAFRPQPNRICPTLLSPRMHWMLLAMGIRSTSTFNLMMDIGRASTVALCSFSPALSLGHTCLVWALRRRSVWR